MFLSDIENREFKRDINSPRWFLLLIKYWGYPNLWPWRCVTVHSIWEAPYKPSK